MWNSRCAFIDGRVGPYAPQRHCGQHPSQPLSSVGHHVVGLKNVLTLTNKTFFTDTAPRNACSRQPSRFGIHIGQKRDVGKPCGTKVVFWIIHPHCPVLHYSANDSATGQTATSFGPTTPPNTLINKITPTTSETRFIFSLLIDVILHHYKLFISILSLHGCPTGKNFRQYTGPMPPNPI